MRPSRRFLLLGGLALGLSALIVSSGLVDPRATLLIWVALIGAGLWDLAVSPRQDRMELSLDGPEEVFSGEPALFDVRIAAPRALTGDVDARLELADALGRMVPFRLLRGNQGRVAQGRVRVDARRRGTFDIKALWLSWPSRLGLWEIVPRIAQARELRVVPNIRPVSSGQIDVTVRSELYGVKDTITRGEGSEFHQLRDFTQGMDTRAIDWKHSARMRSLVAKEMRAERNHQIVVALDNGYLMRGEIDGLPRIDHAINAALATAWAAALGGDLVGLYSFDAEPRLFVPPQPGRAAFPQLRARTAQLAYTSVETNHTLAMAHLNGRLKRRSLIVIFSDFVDTTTAELLVENIQVLSRAHVIVFVTLRDGGLERKLGSETRDLSDMAEAVVAAEMLRERQLVLDRLGRMGVICLDVLPGQLTPALVSTYLTIKAREMI